MLETAQSLLHPPRTGYDMASTKKSGESESMFTLSSLTSPSASTLLKYLLVYPFLIRALYLLRQSWEPLYMNATCLIDLVRVSSPEHYDGM